MNLVEFPGLGGIKFVINRVAFEVVGIPIYWYGIIIATGFLLAVLLGMRNSKLAGIEPDSVLDLVLFAAPVAIICARLFYVIFSWELFKDNPADIINTRKGGLAIYGGVLGALIVAYFFAKRKKIGVLTLLDFGVPYLVMAQGIGRWGNFVNQEAFGSATTLPWRMNSETVNAYLNGFLNNIDLTKWGVHPTFLYESLWDLAIFFFLIWYRKRKKIDGEVFFLYMILYGFGRFFIEGLRTDSLMLGSFRISQLLAAVFVVTFAVLFIHRRKKARGSEDEDVAEIGQSQYGAVLMKLKEEDETSGMPEDSGTSEEDSSEEQETSAPEAVEEKNREESGNEETIEQPPAGPEESQDEKQDGI